MKLPTAHAFMRPIALAALLLSSFAAMAQQINVSGTVTDASGEPVIGASVVAVDSQGGTTTDIDGNYVVSVDPKGKLRFSYIGFTTQTVAVDGRATINVVLQETPPCSTRLLLSVTARWIRKNSPLPYRM